MWSNASNSARPSRLKNVDLRLRLGAPPLVPREFDTSHYAAALRIIGTERDALRVRLAELDRAEAALEKDRAGVVDRVASMCS